MESPSGANVVVKDANDKTATRGMELGPVRSRLARDSSPVTASLLKKIIRELVIVAGAQALYSNCCNPTRSCH